MKLLVLGGGAQGSAAAFDLLRQADVEQVVLADQQVDRIAPFLEAFRGGDKLKLLSLDARDQGQVRAAMDGMDAAVCALPYYFNGRASEMAIDAGAHFCDLGGNTEIVEEQMKLDARAREKGVSVIPDTGLAPGMVNILSQAGIDALDCTHSVRMWVGGLPQHPKPPLNYQIVYSMEGVLDYYTTEGLVLKDGEPTGVEALSGLGNIRFPEPVGELEAFYTAGGISTMPFRYRGKIRNMEYKTLRYPGHVQIMKAIRELGMLELEPVEVKGVSVAPRDVFIAAASPKLRNPKGEDLVALRVEIEGEREGKAHTIRFDLLDYYDAQNGITAMMRTTGYSLAITGLLQASGNVPAGVATPDVCVPAGPYIEALARRGVKIERTEESATA
jgi:lysine 6-dehydrogenase